MRYNPLFIITFALMASAGGWGIWKIASQASSEKPLTSNLSDESGLFTNKNTSSQTQATHRPLSEANSKAQLQPLLAQATQYLSAHRPDEAANYINGIYSQLSSDDLTHFQRLFIEQGTQYIDQDQLQRAKRLFSAGTSVFDDTNMWDALTEINQRLQDWPAALQALLHSSSIENRPAVIETKLTLMVHIAARIEASHQASNDELSIKTLYQNLYEAHANYPHFQLKLAQSHLRLGEIDKAKSLLNVVQYDPELGAIARNDLALIAEDEKEITAPPKQQASQHKLPDIVVPLTRAGNSFLVNSKIDGRNTQLLLDTGASITALSTALISQLNLRPTGQVIQLHTANGVTQSRLYTARKIQLGKISVSNLTIAEIDLNSSQRFQGLLGTDLLNKVNTNFSYVIDNQKNSLIFKRRDR